MRKGAGWKHWGFARETKGNVAILFGLAIIPIILGVGVAVDYGRALSVRSRMADAADASALAVGSWTDLSSAEIQTKAQQFFNANYPASSLGTASAVNVSVVGNDITVKVTGVVPTTFMKLANINSVNVGASSTVTKKQRKIELALVLDTTGSMDSGGKMTSLKSAAKKMVQTLFKGNKSDVKIAVVPFSGAVNVGTDNENADWIDDGSYPNMSNIAKEDHDFDNGDNVFDLIDDMKGRQSWGGCVRERGGSYELTDDAPDQSNKETLFAPYFAPDEPDGDHDDGDSYYNSYLDDGNCGTSKSYKRTPERCQAYAKKYKDERPDEGHNYNCPGNAITALTSNQGQVISAIETLDPKGNTVIPAGLLWGWRALSPGEPFTEDSAYDSDKWVKALVVLTDGENSISGGRNGHNGTVYNAFGYADPYNGSGHLGDKDGDDAEEELDAKTLEVCTAIKAQGIQVYTIGFQIYDNDTKAMLSSCATKTDMAYLSPSNSELAGIFDSIAQGLSDLRIAQ